MNSCQILNFSDYVIGVKLSPIYFIDNRIHQCFKLMQFSRRNFKILSCFECFSQMLELFHVLIKRLPCSTRNPFHLCLCLCLLQVPPLVMIRRCSSREPFDSSNSVIPQALCVTDLSIPSDICFCQPSHQKSFSLALDAAVYAHLL